MKTPLTPNLTLAYARAFACLSAAKCRVEDLARLPALVNVLNQPMYIPMESDPQIDCRPYLPAARVSGERVVFMPAWARAGVRYARMGIDVKRLDPADWYHEWWTFYRETFEGVEDSSDTGKAFIALYESLAVDEDEIRTFIDGSKLVIDREAITKLVR